MVDKMVKLEQWMTRTLMVVAEGWALAPDPLPEATDYFGDKAPRYHANYKYLQPCLDGNPA
jgi:hypothetical protein